MSQIPAADIVSLVWFVGLWVGYTLYADRLSHRPHSLRQVMHAHRYEWMRRMLERESRIVDASILNNLLQGVSFFASTTLLILLGMVTILGATDRVILLVRELPFTSKMTLVQWELKLLVLIIIFVHAFFKFTWAMRQFNYCSILVGSAPPPGDESVHDNYARRAALVSTQAAKDYNQGLRAYYFALAALGWFMSPWMFVSATTVVVAVLYWREYYSATLKMLASPANEQGL